MEAADDIAYATGDMQDVLKKGLVDYETIRSTLKATSTGESKKCVANYLERPYNEEFKDLDARERRQLTVQRFCQMAVRLMMKSAIEAFCGKFGLIMKGTFDGDLVGAMSMCDLCEGLKNILSEHVLSHVEIAQREQTAHRVIDGLLGAITDELHTRPEHPLAKYTYRPSRENPNDRECSAPYSTAMRAVDYVSGLSDAHAITHYQRIFGMSTSF
jgi:dGTP triphosphohydrolase